jgi:hypothetical protein
MRISRHATSNDKTHDVKGGRATASSPWRRQPHGLGFALACVWGMIRAAVGLG